MKALSLITAELAKGIPLSAPELAQRTGMEYTTVVKAIRNCRDRQGEICIRIAAYREVGISLHVTAFYGLGVGDVPKPRSKLSLKQAAQRKRLKARKLAAEIKLDPDSDNARDAHIARMAAEADAAIAKYRPNLAALRGNVFATVIAQVCHG